jgi:dTDP-3,4-didehydro-2,6-dideoxy-alpha-D-glucose 3-reductase
MKKKVCLNIACLGAGNHAFKNTLPALLTLKEFKLVGIYKRKLQKNLDNLKQFSCKISSDLNTILNTKKLNAVYIASQPGAHYSLAKQALLSNKHVIIEKPAVTNFFQAKKLYSIASKKKLVIMEAFMYKYHNQFPAILNLLKKNKDKKLIKVSSTFGFPHLDKSNFRYNFKAGGGALLDAGSYAVSSVRCLSNEKITLKNTQLIKNNYDVDIKGFAEFDSTNKTKYKANWYFGGKYKNQISLKYKEINIYINRAFSKPNNLVTFIDFYKNNKLIKSNKIKKDDHFKNMFNFFHKCCFKKDLRLSENFEFLNQAKTLNEIFLKNKKLFKKKK